jgi:DNA-binding Lrp family transcriptional regulator
MTIEEKDLPLLIALQQHPLAPASKLAEIVGVSTPTIITRLEDLKKDKSYYSVYADLKAEALGLEIVDVILQVRELENISFIEQKICYEHPYTLFRIRCFGERNGLFLQFRIPKGSRKNLLKLLDHLKKDNKIHDYFIPNYLPNTRKIFTNANLANWQPAMMKWSFDWDEWISKLSTMGSKKLELNNGKSYLKKLDDLDIALLQALTMNARRKNTEIMAALNLDKNTVGLPQKVSRRLQFLREKIVSQFRVFLKWDTFEIYNSFLIVANCPPDKKFQLQNTLYYNPIPFESLYKVTKNGFMWYLRCPSSHFSDVSAFVLSITNQAQFYFLDYKTSEFYGLWKGAFDPKTHSWDKNSIDLSGLFS